MCTKDFPQVLECDMNELRHVGEGEELVVTKAYVLCQYYDVAGSAMLAAA